MYITAGPISGLKEGLHLPYHAVSEFLQDGTCTHKTSLGYLDVSATKDHGCTVACRG